MSELRQTALTGARWTIAARIGLQLVTWPITIVVMRLLEPGDYGVFAIAMLVHAFVTMFAELGLGVALVQASQVSAAQSRMAASVVLGLNLSVMAVIAVLAPWVATEYDEPEVKLVLWALSAELLIVAVSSVPLAMLERELRYRAVSQAQIAGGVAGAVVTLGAALADAGVWALVAGALTGAVVRSTGWIVANRGLVVPGRVRRADVEPMVKVSGHTLASRLLWFWSGHADSLLLGLQLNATALGHYNVASQLAMLPAGKAMEAVNKVTFPLLCRSRDDAAITSAFVDRVRTLLALYGFGVCWALAAVAPEFVGLVLGSKWEMAVLPLALLSLMAPLRMLSAFNNSVVTALDAPGAATREQFMAALVIPTAVALGATFGGLSWAAGAWVVCYPAVFLMSVVLTSKVLRQSRRTALRPIAAPFVAGLIMLIGVEAARRGFGDAAPLAARLVVQLAIGVGIYLGALRLLRPALLRETLDLVRELVRPGR